MSNSEIPVIGNVFGCCSQGRPTQMWSVNGVPEGHSQIKIHPRIAVGLTQCKWETVTSVNSFNGISDFWPLSLSLCISSCDKTAVVRQGDATSDTECELEAITSNLQPKNLTGESHTKIMATTAATTMTTVSATSDSKTSHEPAGPAESINPSVMATEFNPPTKGPPLVAAATLGR